MLQGLLGLLKSGSGLSFCSSRQLKNRYGPTTVPEDPAGSKPQRRAQGNGQAMTHPNPDFLPVVTACRKRDIPILKRLVDLAVPLLGASELHIITHRANLAALGKLPAFVQCHDQDTIIPSMTLDSLRSRTDLAEMPLAAGWYFQQFLKLSLQEHFPHWRRFLIWDSDTLPLRRIDCFDPEGRMIFTKADEWHAPYFCSFEHLLGIVPTCRQSFIAQHVPVDVDVLVELKSRINARFPGKNYWTWKIMENIPPQGRNRFSEYETIAHYSLAVHPERCLVRQIPWMRHGTKLVGRRPEGADLEFLSGKYAFAAFESSESPLRRLAQPVYARLPEAFRRLIRRGN